MPDTADQVLGQVNDGWTVASRLLSHERAAVSGASPYETGPRISDRRGGQADIAAVAELAGRGEDPLIRQLLGEARLLDRVHRALVRRIGTSIRTGRLGTPAGSIPRLSNGLNSVRLAAIALEIGGGRTVAWEEGDPGGNSASPISVARAVAWAGEARRWHATSSASGFSGCHASQRPTSGSPSAKYA